MHYASSLFIGKIYNETLETSNSHITLGTSNSHIILGTNNSNITFERSNSHTRSNIKIS